MVTWGVMIEPGGEFWLQGRQGEWEERWQHMNKNIQYVNILTCQYIFQEFENLKIWNLKNFTTMVRYKGFEENSAKKLERDEALIISCKACLFFIVFDGKKNIYYLKFVLTVNPWLLNSFDFRTYGSELRKRYTLRLFLMCLAERSFGGCSTWGDGGEMAYLGERGALGELGVGGNYKN